MPKAPGVLEWYRRVRGRSSRRGGRKKSNRRSRRGHGYVKE